MRKQTKLGLMLAAAALVTLGTATVASARGWVQQNGNWYYQDGNGDFVTETIQTSGNNKFYLGESGAMVTNYFLEDYGDGNNTYYFGSNGAMVTNTWVAIDPSNVSNAGDNPPTAYWYYFQASGKAYKASSGNIKKVTIDGKKYGFNEYGQMLTGWIQENGELVDVDEENPFENGIYYAGGENDGVLRTGWLQYADGYENNDMHKDKNVLWFYFNTTNNKKLAYDVPEDDIKTKTIDGKKYAFQGYNGIMLSKWDAYDLKWSEGTGSEGNPGFVPAHTDAKNYYSGEDDGHQVKKGWIYAVPSQYIDSEKYNDDEEKYMYFGNSGDIVTNQIKKINGKYYAFNKTGIMKTGLVIFSGNGFEDAFDMDNTKGGEIAKWDTYRNGDNEAKTINLKGRPNGKIHYFGDDGARRTGSNVIEFADDSYTFGSNNSGNYDGLKSKKYYSNGILLKASSDIRYGLVATENFATIEWGDNDGCRSLEVVNTGGTKVKGANSAKKDADGNYWLISNGNTDSVSGTVLPKGYLVGIYTVNVKWATSGASLKVDNVEYGSAQPCYAFQSDWNGTSNKWIPFGTTDQSGKTCSVIFGEGDYQVTPTKDYSLNFHWADIETM